MYHAQLVAARDVKEKRNIRERDQQNQRKKTIKKNGSSSVVSDAMMDVEQIECEIFVYLPRCVNDFAAKRSYV